MIFVNEERCTLCGDCVEACPWQALSLAEGKLVIDRDLCGECGACLRLCPVGAIYEVEPAPVAALNANAEPIVRADSAAIGQPAKPEKTSVLAFPRVVPSPLWIGALPLAARFVGGLADWWLDRRRLSTWHKRSSPVARRGLGGRTPPAAQLTGSPGIRRRWRRGRGR